MKREKRSGLSQFYRLISVLLAALLLTNCSMASSATQNTSKPNESIASSTELATVEPVASPQLPSPPVPMTVSAQAPDQAAGELVKAMDDPEKLAAWLGLYKALGIPVIGTDRKALDGSDDPIGPAYWQVWYAGTLDMPGHGIRISDAGELLGQVLELSQEDSDALGEILLSDLRSALNSTDASVQLLAAFVRERILHTGQNLDITDSATTAQNASIDIPTLQLIFWVLLRETLIQRAAQFSLNHGGLLLISHSLSKQLQAASLNCSEIYGNADATYWTNWLVNKAVGGVQLPGMQKALPGLMERALGELGMSEDSFATVSKAMGWANAVGSAISLLMQLASMEVVGIQEPDKLIRTKDTKYDGEEATIYWRLDTYPDNPDDSNKTRQCFISYVSNILGAGFSFPEGGVIAGAEMDFKGGMNIPDRVFIAKGDQVRSWTDSNGGVALSMLGKAQEHKVPDSAKQVDMEYSVFVSAQPEEAGLNSMANIFFGGLTFGATPGATGFISSMLDVLKTFTYDMGEHVFPMVDWQQKSYRASGGQNMNMIGTICDLGKPFQLNAMGNNGISYDFSFSPDNDTSGSFQYSGSAQGCTESGGGSYTVQLNDDGSSGKVLVDVSGSIDCPDFSNKFSDSGSFDLTADPASSCP